MSELINQPAQTNGQMGFLNQMQSTVIGTIVSVTKYEIDTGQKGGSIWVSKPTSGDNENVLGEELIKIKIPFALFDQLKQKLDAKEISIPGQFEILVNIDMGGQNKATLTAVSIRKYVPEPVLSSSGLAAQAAQDTNVQSNKLKTN